VSPLARERLRNVLLILALLIATAVFVGSVDIHYAVRRWLFWRYAWYWFLTLAWGASCLSFGAFVLDKLRLYEQLERGAALVIAFAVGVVGFFLAINLLGFVGVLGVPVFVLLPLAFLASGARHWRGARDHLLSITAGFSRRDLPFILFGAAGIALQYVQLISPEGLHYDARWYHMPIAQQYALQGAVRAFPEGWWCATYPKMASYLYTWAMLLPKSLLFDRVELALHMQMLALVATIFSVPALVRRLIPDTKGSLTWIALLLFPTLFLYDSNVSGAADHFPTLLSIPLFLAVFEVWDRWDLARCALLGLLVSGVMLAKYSAWIVLPLPALAFIARGLWLLVRVPEKRREVLLGFGLVLALIVAFTSTLFVANWIWYGDPMYPVLRNVFKNGHPWNPDAAGSWAVNEMNLSKPPPGLKGWLDTLRTTFTFSFIPNDKYSLHRNVPIFGSLFTLLFFALPFLRAGRRTWAVVAAIFLSIIMWYRISHYDRYLMTLIPWMSAVVGAAIILVWRTRNRVAQLSVALMVMFQIVWGLDVPFYETHNQIPGGPMHAALTLAGTGFRGTPNRLRPFGNYGEVGEYLPRDANVLVHDSPLHLGIDAKSVQDQWQGLISYAELQSPARIQRMFQDLKITHVLWISNFITGWNSLAHDAAFFNYALNHTSDQRQFGGLTVGTMSTQPITAPFNDSVAVICQGQYAPGWYRLGALRVLAGVGTMPSPEGPIGDLEAAVQKAGFLIVEPHCPPLPASVGALFQPPAQRGATKVYVRRAPGR
jgi:hypothetical protein